MEGTEKKSGARGLELDLPFLGGWAAYVKCEN